MDPEAALRMAHEAWKDSDLDTMREHLEAYAQWRNRGGFRSRQDDAQYRLLRRMLREPSRFTRGR